MSREGFNEIRDLYYISTQLETNKGSNWQGTISLNNLQDVHVLLDIYRKLEKYLQENVVILIVLMLVVKEARNKWAHSRPISSDDADRYLDTAMRLAKI